MRTARALLLASILVLAASPARPSVDVYVGFMDEEVNDVLKTLIKEHPGRRVIVIERGGDIRPDGRLFQRPISSYGGGPPEILTTAQGAAGDSPQAEIAKRLGERLVQDKFKAQLQEMIMSGNAPPKTVKKGALSTTMTVATFNTSASAKDPIVLLRSPEMGLQASMVTPYLEPIMDVLKGLPAARAPEGGIHASVFGTGGAISASLHPGELSRVKGSVFVGAEKVPGGYRGVVSVSDGRSQPSTFFSENFPTREQAEAAAARAFSSSKAQELPAVSGPMKGKTLQAAVRAIDPGEGAVSLTLSFFGGEEMKTAGRTLGLGDVNMEDYHVLNAVGTRVDTLDVTRLNCDPHEITPEATRLISRWAKSERYTIRTYEDAILWGIRGTPQDGMPASAQWRALQGLPQDRVREMALSTSGKGGDAVVLDPFYAEIATDFLADAASGKLLTSKEGDATIYTRMVSKKVTDGLSQAELAQLDGILKTKSEKIQEMAKALQRHAEAAKTTEALEALRPDIRLLLLATKDVPIPEGPLRTKIGEILAAESAAGKLDYFRKTGELRLMGAANAPSAGDETPMELWVREGKWGGNRERVLDHMIAPPDRSAGGGEVDHALLSVEAEAGVLSGSNVDRALYKSTITPGTQIASPGRVLVESERLQRVGRTFAQVGQLTQELTVKGVPPEKIESIRERVLRPCR